jgi:hypothetical protein
MNRRAWFRFTTRSLLIATTAVSVSCWWLQSRIAQAKKQAKAVSKLEALGVAVGYRHEWDAERDCFAKPSTPGPAFLRAMLGDHFFIKPDTIIAVEYNGTSSQLAPIADLKTVTGIGITDTPIGDDVLQYLSQLPDLKELSLFGTQVTDDGLQSLTALPNLSSVVVTKTQVTADGIARFKKICPQCQVWTEKVEGFDENDLYHVAAVDGLFSCHECGAFHTGSPLGSQDISTEVDF